MLENRNLKRDLFALALLALVAFLALSIVTYRSSDEVVSLIAPLDRLHQPDQLVHPAIGETENAAGRWGALFADVLLTNLGGGAYYLVFSLALLNVRLLRRKKATMPVLRTSGWLVSLVGLTMVLSFPPISPGPVIGCGGYLGALGAGLLQMHFAFWGSLIISVGLLVCGLLLCTDYTLFRIARWTIKSLLSLFGLRSRHAMTSPEMEADAEAEDEPVSIKIRRKQNDDQDLESDDDLEDDELEETVEVEPEEEEHEAPIVVKTPRPAETPPKRRKPSFLLRRKSERVEREQVMSELDEAESETEEVADYELPDMELLVEGEEFCYDEQEKEIRRKARILEKTFGEFGFNVKVVEIETGPVIAQYEIQLEAGLRLSKITGLADDLAIALRVPSVRIVAPIPGKNTVGIEVPNETRQVVRLREVMEESNGKAAKMQIPIFLGKDVSGNSMVADLAKLPHLLIAGRTGTGKSVCLNAIISSMLMTRRPDEVRMLMIDPKMVELSGYRRLPHLMHPVVTDMKKAEAILAWAVEKMEERYALLAQVGVRHITSYNQLGEEELMKRLELESEEDCEQVPTHLPYIVIVADEMADLMMTAGKDVEQHIIRLAQKSRAVGIHLILATQKPTVDVITGLIKSNLPARIAFQVASRTDSRVVLDEMGADKLLGNGDMLFLWPGTSTLLRGQGTYLSDDEIDAVTDSVSTDEPQFVRELVEMKVEEGDDNQPEALKKRDDLYESAVDVVVREGRGSVSLLQRTLGIGYGRAARLIDFMAEDKIVGEYAGSQAREVLISLADWERMQHGEATEEDDDEQLSVYDDKSTTVKPQDQSIGESEEYDEAGAETQEYDDEYEEEEYEEEDAEYEYQ